MIVVNARKVRLIGESRKKDDRLDAQTLARLARIEPALLYPVKHRSAQAQADLMMIRARAGLVRARTGLVNTARGLAEVLRGTLARLQRAQPGSGESRRAESGTATGAGAVAGDDRRAEREDLRVQRPDRSAGRSELSASVVVWFWPGFGTRAIKIVSPPAQPPASSPAK